ncbi:MAG TPA: tripartite tricarboxylate transporter substrate binding protein [Burkholderiales bacterium]|nr:tripartite tricarboxylate transporter substrate binding protein [Burkholderiales bacterium]
MRTKGLMTAILGLLLAAGGAQAQEKYPTRPIRLLVPFPAGGQTDIITRTFAQKLTEAFKQTVVVDNRPGAAGSIGTEIAVKASPDGYTFIMVSTSYAANAALYKLSFDPLSDMVPVVMVGEIANLVTAHPSGPAKNIKELVAYAKANPGKLNYGSGGTGSGNHLAAELFNQMAGTRMTHVPYKGATSATSDLIGGQIQLIFAGLPGMIPHVKANRVRGLAVTGAKRSNTLPGVPTVAETVPGYEAVSWAAVLAPKGLPKNILARWNGEFNRILQQPDVKARMAADGLEPIGGSPEILRATLKRDIAKWRGVVSAAGIKVGG